MNGTQWTSSNQDTIGHEQQGGPISRPNLIIHLVQKLLDEDLINRPTQYISKFLHKTLRVKNRGGLIVEVGLLSRDYGMVG